MRLLRHLRAVVRRHEHVTDLAVAVTVFVVALLNTPGPHHVRDRPSMLLAAVACGALLIRRPLPYPALLLSTVGAEAYLAVRHGQDGTLILGAPLIALYTLAESGTRRRALVLGGIVVVAIGALHTFGAFASPAKILGPENLALAALGGLAVAAGDAARSRRAYLEEVMRRAADAERDREAEARRRITEERLRIARELHDSVGHHLALINVQAGVAAHVGTGESPAVRETLAEIKQGSRAALEELRDTVGLLRRPDEPAAPVEPAAGLAALDGLLAACRRTGLRVSLHRDGAERALPRAVDLIAYRVVQESLTNACKHAGAAEVRLTVRYEPQLLSITVDNEVGAAAATPAEGGRSHGIQGMRERVAAIGGTLLAGPRPTGGFRVSAVLPT
jgi:signal transduction histidine kinase